MNLLHNFLCNITDSSKEHAAVVDDFYSYLISAIDKIFKKSKLKSKSTFPTNPWFDEECKLLKSYVGECIRNNACSEVQTAHKQNYKRIVQQKKRHYQLQVALSLNAMHGTRPSDYWQYWKSLKKQSGPDNLCIELDTFTNHYRDNSIPTFNANFDYAIIDKISEAMSRHSGDDPLYDDASMETINDILNAPISELKSKNRLRSQRTKRHVEKTGYQLNFLNTAKAL